MSGILLALAHPDDESFVGGGTLAHYAAQGVSTALLCATDGQAGRAGLTGREPLTSRELLGQIRRAELTQAAHALGIGELITPGWLDGQLSAMPDQQGVELMMSAFRQTRPEIVISFGPEGGGNQHADHKATSRWALRAFDLAHEMGADFAPLKLYWITWPAGFHPIAEIKVDGAPVTTTIELNEEMQRRKLEAFMAHATQQDFLERFKRIQEAGGGQEHFHLARSRVGKSDGMERDMFERIERCQKVGD